MKMVEAIQEILVQMKESVPEMEGIMTWKKLLMQPGKHLNWKNLINDSKRLLILKNLMF